MSDSYFDLSHGVSEERKKKKKKGIQKNRELIEDYDDEIMCNDNGCEWDWDCDGRICISGVWILN